MANQDDPNKKGYQDRSKVSSQSFELDYTANDLGITEAELIAIKQRVGDSRKAIEAEVARLRGGAGKSKWADNSSSIGATFHGS